MRLAAPGQLWMRFDKLFTEMGGKIHFNSAVEEILVDDNRKVNGIRLANGEVHQADIVISNADVAFT